jgi:hypothetical protein
MLKNYWTSRSENQTSKARHSESRSQLIGHHRRQNSATARREKHDNMPFHWLFIAPTDPCNIHVSKPRCHLSRTFVDSSSPLKALARVAPANKHTNLS